MWRRHLIWMHWFIQMLVCVQRTWTLFPVGISLLYLKVVRTLPFYSGYKSDCRIIRIFISLRTDIRINQDGWTPDSLDQILETFFKSNLWPRIPTLKVKIPGKAFLKSESRPSSSYSFWPWKHFLYISQFFHGSVLVKS